MDWKGQRVSEQIMQVVLLVFGLVSLTTGYAIGSFRLMILTYAAGVILTALIILPNWPLFKRNPLKWLDPVEADCHPKPQVAALAPNKTVSNRK